MRYLATTALLLAISACGSHLNDDGSWQLGEQNQSEAHRDANDGCVYIGGVDRLRFWGEHEESGLCLQIRMTSPTVADYGINTSSLELTDHWDVAMILADPEGCGEGVPRMSSATHLSKLIAGTIDVSSTRESLEVFVDVTLDLVDLDENILSLRWSPGVIEIDPISNGACI